MSERKTPAEVAAFIIESFAAGAAIYSSLALVGPGAWVTDFQLQLFGLYWPFLTVLILVIPPVTAVELIASKVGITHYRPHLRLNRDKALVLFGFAGAAFFGTIVLNQITAPDVGKIDATFSNSQNVRYAYALVNGVTTGEYATIAEASDGPTDLFIPIFDPKAPDNPASFVVEVNGNKVEQQLHWQPGKPGLVQTRGLLQHSLSAEEKFLLHRHFGNALVQKPLVITTNVTREKAYGGIPFVIFIAVMFPLYLVARKVWEKIQASYNMP